MSITETQIGRDSSDDSPLIKLGEISYINCEIFNYPLNKIIQSRGRVTERTSSRLRRTNDRSVLWVHEDHEDDENAEIGVRLHAENTFKIKISSGVPSHLNKLFAEGLIDAAPISSFAYLSIKEHCKLLKRISISAFGKVKSVLLFSTQNLKELKSLQQEGLKPKIYISEESASSVGLLKILLAEKYALDINNIEFIRFSGRGEGLANKLLIGDKALLEASQISEFSTPNQEILSSPYQYIYDLGEEWFDLSNGLPMVFGVWAHKLNSNKERFLQEIILAAKTMGLNQDLDEIINKISSETGLKKEILNDYFQTLNYDFTDEHIQGLALYESYLNKWALI
ncbi:MAG: menaquinone biosynthesis protein [Vampirovibrionia bacterium]